MTLRVAADRWLLPGDADPEAAVRLFLLHHSGGGAAMYRDWLPLLPTDVAVQRVQLPGRHERRDEPPFDLLEPLVTALADVIEADLDGRPYGMFGHSMGALLAYRVAVALERGGRQAPALVAASGWAPRGFARPLTPEAPEVATAGDNAVVGAMRRLGAWSPELEEHPELLAAAVRAMRADSAACADYRDDGARLGCPVVAYGGRDDPLVAPGAMRSWAERTPDFLGVREFPGGHFFISGNAASITADLVSLLRRYA